MGGGGESRHKYTTFQVSKISEVFKKRYLKYITENQLNQLFSYNSGGLSHFLYFDLSNTELIL